MTETSTQRKVGIKCPERCQFNPDTIGWDAANKLAAVRARGAGAVVWKRAAEDVLGRKINPSSIQRHFKHYVVSDDRPELDPDSPKPGDIEILDSIIGAGYRNSRNWKPTIRDTLEAMKLKTAMTGNSAFEDLLGLFDAEDGDEDDEPLPENPEAVLSEDERSEEEEEEDLPAPLEGE